MDKEEKSGRENLKKYSWPSCTKFQVCSTFFHCTAKFVNPLCQQIAWVTAGEIKDFSSRQKTISASGSIILDLQFEYFTWRLTMEEQK